MGRRWIKSGLIRITFGMHLPFVKRYLVLGAFPKADVNSIAERLPPENDVGALSQGTYQGIGGKTLEWQEVEAAADGKLDLAQTPR